MTTPPSERETRKYLSSLDLRGLQTDEGFQRWIGILSGAKHLGFDVKLNVQYEGGYPWRIEAYAVAASPVPEPRARTGDPR